jgi:predicted DCC family thiol-disulfide oxidoreductase YuxK
MHEAVTPAQQDGDPKPAAPEAAAPGQMTVVFDGDCPVCTAYSCNIATGAQSKIINARTGGPLVDDLVARGIDLDEGMAVIHEGKVFHGAEAVQMMALHGPRNGWLRRLNHIVFRSATRSRILYPVLRSGRNLLLRILGRKKISASKRG